MCGICGLVSASPLSEGDGALVARMNAAMVHRGPDGDGEFADTNVRLAMRRLSIIDLAGGWQPLYNEDRSLALVANGEVYNFVELRQGLEARGHRFRTRSDCETALHLYEDHGLEFVHHLRGMYAIALWDSHRRRLVIVRDRMGEKPVYLAERGAPDGRAGAGRILFASEMRALLAGGAVPFDLDPAGVNDYLHFGYVPEPATAVAGVRKLPAGCMLIVDVDPWRIEQRRYWSMDQAPPLDGDPPRLIRDELDRISELVIRSDVPVGVALSGGLDSSAIAAMAASRYPGTMHAFTVGYTGRPRQDERAMARELADHLRMPLHEIEVDPREMVEFFPTLAGLRDDPINDIAGHGYWAVSRAARRAGVPVLLQGQGGDELFWGYPWVRAALDASHAKAQGRRPGRLETARRLLPDGPGFNPMVEWAYRVGGLAAGWRRLTPDPQAPPEQLVFYDSTSTFQMAHHVAPRLLTGQFARRAAGPGQRRPESVFTLPRPWGDLGVLMTRLISETYLLENGIAQGDRLSMANSVELRLPLVDYRLVEVVIGLRKSRPDHHLPPKQWFREAVKDVVPEWVMARRKRGFNPPTTEWTRALREGHGRALRDGFLVQGGVIRPEAVGRLLRRHGRFSPWSEAFTKALVLEFWCRAMAHAAAGGGPAPAQRAAAAVTAAAAASVEGAGGGNGDAREPSDAAPTHAAPSVAPARGLAR
jgi:asparagine synthase (glutamine-hydrolysing)